MSERITPPTTGIQYVTHDPSEADFANVEPVVILRYWSGAPAPAGRQFSVRMLWSDSALWILFEGEQDEPYIAASDPDLGRKTHGLWDRDVFEIFIAPDRDVPEKYFEFEAAPTGEWIDIALEASSGSRLVDWEYSSGMRVVATVMEKTKAGALITIPFSAFGVPPKAGDIWRGNLYRCIGTDPDRGYLAWSPTFTDEPNFHVPSKFGSFIFVR